MKRLFFFAFLATIGSPAFSQIQYGTVGVVYYTKDKIIIAADSRGLVGNLPPDDTVCKIAAPRGQMVFVSSNAIGYKNAGIGDLVDSWSNVEEIHRAHDMAFLLYSTSHDRIVGTAFEWGNLITSHFQSLLLQHPEKLIDVVRKGNGVLTIAEMGGLDSDGTLIRLETEIIFRERAFPAIFSETKQFSECPKSYCAIGEIEVEQEFVNLSSERSRQEARKWKPPKKSKRVDYEIL